MRIEEQREQQRQAMQQAAIGVYAALMRKRAESPDENLSDETEQAALDEASVTLGYSDSRRLADLDLIQKAIRHEQRIAALATEVEPHVRAQADADAYRDETAEVYSQRHQEQERLDMIVVQFGARQTQLDREKKELAELTASNWQLLAAPDPVSEARKVHLYQAVGTHGRPAGATHDTLAIEQVMLSPRGHRLDNRDVVPMVGQSQKQVDALLAIHQQLLDAHMAWIQSHTHGVANMLQCESPRVNYPFGIYLMRAEQLKSLESFASVAFTPERAALLYVDFDVDPVILTPPGQSKAEAAELRAAYEKLVKEPRAKRQRLDASLDGHDNPNDAPVRTIPEVMSVTQFAPSPASSFRTM